MKINNKGFTLIELLAVVVILLAISVIAISSISAAIERNKVKQKEAKIDIILTYAKLYFDSHRNTENDGCIKLDDLDKYLSDSDRIDADGNDFDGVIKYDKDLDNAIDIKNSMSFFENENCP